MSCHCEYRKPKCEKGRKLHAKMSRHFLKHGQDEEHQKLWRKWKQEHLDNR